MFFSDAFFYRKGPALFCKKVCAIQINCVILHYEIVIIAIS